MLVKSVPEANTRPRYSAESHDLGPDTPSRPNNGDISDLRPGILVYYEVVQTLFSQIVSQVAFSSIVQGTS